jgi:hypothetical protein
VGVNAKVANFWLRLLVVKVITSRSSFDSSGSRRFEEKAVLEQSIGKKLTNTYLLQ